MQIYKFRNRHLNTVERRVIKDGQFLKLTPRPFDVLLLLVESSGQIVTKDEMLGKVWNGSFVEEGNLPVHISTLRKLLGERHNRHFIETVQGNGYRFVALVEAATDQVWNDQIQSEGSDMSSNLEIGFLADVIAESLIDSLPRLSTLKTLARNAVFRHKNNDNNGEEIAGNAGGGVYWVCQTYENNLRSFNSLSEFTILYSVCVCSQFLNFLFTGL